MNVHCKFPFELGNVKWKARKDPNLNSLINKKKLVNTKPIIEQPQTHIVIIENEINHFITNFPLCKANTEPDQRQYALEHM